MKKGNVMGMLAAVGLFMAAPAAAVAGGKCNVGGCPGHEVPSLEAQNIVRTVADKLIRQNPMLANSVAPGNPPKLEWRVSPVPPLNYGVMHLVVNGPNGSQVDLPLRFYVADRGLKSLVISGAFMDANGEPVDKDQVKMVMLKMPGAAPAGPKAAAEIEKKQWAVVHPGKVRVVLFTDPDCPFCDRLRPSVVRMLREHPEVGLEVYYTPLTMLHPTARAKALVLLSVPAKQRLEAEGILHNVQSDDLKVLKQALEAKGIMVSPMLEKFAARRLEEGIRIAQKAGFGNSTPIVAFVGSHDVVAGAVPYEQLVSHLKSGKGGA